MSSTNPPRASDAKALRMLALRDARKTAPEIARACGTTPGTVRSVLRRIDTDYTRSEAK